MPKATAPILAGSRHASAWPRARTSSLSGPPGLACPGQGLGLGDEQIDPCRLGEDDTGPRQGQPSAGEVTGRLGEGEAGTVGLRRHERPRHHSVGAPAGAEQA